MNAVARWGLAVVAAAGLGIDAYTHLHLAHNYMYNTTGTVNEQVLFQIEGAAAIVAGVWILLRPGLLSSAFALAVTGGGAFALLLYRYDNVGKLGPIPNMYEPVWFTEKEWALAGELVALAAAAALLTHSLVARRAGRRTKVLA